MKRRLAARLPFASAGSERCCVAEVAGETRLDEGMWFQRALTSAVTKTVHSQATVYFQYTVISVSSIIKNVKFSLFLVGGSCPLGTPFGCIGGTAVVSAAAAPPLVPSSAASWWQLRWVDFPARAGGVLLARS